MRDYVLGLSDLENFCKETLQDFSQKQIVLLNGTLGAGKTELVKNFVKSLGGKESSSPTYSLINEYSCESISVYHIDLYRIKDEDDLESIGFWDIFENEKAIVFIEWPSRIDINNLPITWAKLSIDIEKSEDDKSRCYKKS